MNTILKKTIFGVMITTLCLTSQTSFADSKNGNGDKNHRNSCSGVVGSYLSTPTFEASADVTSVSTNQSTTISLHGDNTFSVVRGASLGLTSSLGSISAGLGAWKCVGRNQVKVTYFEHFAPGTDVPLYPPIPLAPPTGGTATVGFPVGEQVTTEWDKVFMSLRFRNCGNGECSRADSASVLVGIRYVLNYNGVPTPATPPTYVSAQTAVGVVATCDIATDPTCIVTVFTEPRLEQFFRIRVNQNDAFFPAIPN